MYCFWYGLINEFLTAETRINRHQANQIYLFYNIFQNRNRRMWIESDTRSALEGSAEEKITSLEEFDRESRLFHPTWKVEYLGDE